MTSAWAGLRHGRWGVPAVAVVAVLVVVAAVAVALVLRAGTTLPTTDFSSAAEGGGAVAGDAPAVEDAAPGAGGAVDGRPPGASASPPAGSGGAAAEDPAGGAAGAAGAAGSAAAAAPGQAPVVVHVVGQVARPGLVRVPAGSRVADAVEAAGGLTAEADAAAVNLARAVLDGEQLLVPRPGEVPVGAPPAVGVPGAALPVPGAPGAPAGAAPGGLVGLNTATLAELDALPGIGPVLAQRIVDFREANGAFTSVEDLAEVTGIGDAVLADVRPLVTV